MLAEGALAVFVVVVGLALFLILVVYTEDPQLSNTLILIAFCLIVLYVVLKFVIESLDRRKRAKNSEYEVFGEDRLGRRCVVEKGTRKNGEWHGAYWKCDEAYGYEKEKGFYNMGEQCGEWIEPGETVTYNPCPSGGN